MSDLILPRRKFLAGLMGLVATLAVVRAESLMRVRSIVGFTSYAPPLYGPLGPELARITRKAFIPRVYVQIYESYPLLQHFLENETT